MAHANAPKGYTSMQILLHWIIAALVIFQLIFGEDIHPAYRAFGKGTVPAAGDLFNARLHVYVGITVLILAIWRLFIRFRHGVPLLPADENPILKAIAIATHGILYLAIFGMPISGMIAWYGGFHEIGDIHTWGKPVLIIFVSIHALAALWQHFVAKTDVLMRMLKPQRRSA